MEYKVIEKDLEGQIEGFPIEVVQRMVDCQVEQGNKADIVAFQKMVCSNPYGFDWSKTEEGLNFWHEVIGNWNFNLFFQKYPKKNN